jgi:hypothetical protein
LLNNGWKEAPPLRKLRRPSLFGEAAGLSLPNKRKTLQPGASASGVGFPRMLRPSRDLPLLDVTETASAASSRAEARKTSPQYIHNMFYVLNA